MYIYSQKHALQVAKCINIHVGLNGHISKSSCQLWCYETGAK